MTIERYLYAGIGALSCWIAALALIAIAAEPTASVIAFGPRANVLEASVLAGGAVTGLGQLATQIRSDRSGFVRTLYAGGAWLVLPIPDSLCFGDRPALRP